MRIKNFIKLVDSLPIISYSDELDEKTLVALCKDLLVLLYYLKNHINCQYKILSSISGVDFCGIKYRFGIVYDLLSLTNNCRLRLKIFINEITPVESSISVYKNADW